MPLDTHKPANYRRAWKGEDAAAHLRPDWTITVCDACLTATCWQGEFYCEKAKGAGTREMTIAEARQRNQENPTWWLKDESIKQRLAAERPAADEIANLPGT